MIYPPRQKGITIRAATEPQTIQGSAEMLQEFTKSKADLLALDDTADARIAHQRFVEDILDASAKGTLAVAAHDNWVTFLRVDDLVEQSGANRKTVQDYLRCPLPVARCPLPVARCPLPGGVIRAGEDD